jgi:iron complex outermembrane receptor protein
VDGVELEAGTASHDTWRGRATTGAATASGSWMASATRMRSDGPDLYFPELDAPDTNFGRTSGTDYDRHDSAFASYSNGHFTATGLLGARTKGVPTGAYGITFNDPRSKNRDTRGYVDVQYRRPAWNDGEVLARAFYDESRYDGWWVFDEGERINRDETVGRWMGGEVLASRRLHPRHFVTAGVEFRGNVRQDQRNFDEGGAVLLDDRHSSALWAAFVQDEVSVHDTLQIILGARYDHAGLTGSTVEPRLGAVYRPSERTSVKALFGGAFRAPNTYELFYQEASSKANPDLEAETLQTIEGVFEHNVRPFRFTATIYRTGIHELINQTVDEDDGLLQFRNLERAHAWGTAFDVEYRHRGAVARVSYAYQKAIDADTGLPLTNSPRHVAVLAAGAPIWRDRLTVGLETSYTGSRLGRSGDSVAASWVARGNLVASVVPGRLDLTIGVGNLFDTRYYHPTGAELLMERLQQDGRTARAGLIVRF